MSPLLSRQPVPWDLDVRFMNGARLGLVALAGFSFAVTFVAGSRTSHPAQRGLPATPVSERASDFGPALASRFEPTGTLPDLLPAHTVAPPVTARPRPARPVTATPRAPTSSSAVAPPPVPHPPRRRIVRQPRTPVAPPPSAPAPPPQTFDSSGTPARTPQTFDSSG